MMASERKFLKISLVHLLVVLLLLINQSFATATTTVEKLDDTGEESTSTSNAVDTSNAPVRHRFQLPRLFDFDQFKQTFKRTYNHVEEMIRNKIFMARAFQVFLAAIGYRHRKRSSYLSINHLSDLTPGELNEMYMKKNPIQEMQEAEAKDASNQVEVEVEKIPSIDKEQLELALSEIAREHPEEPTIREMSLAQVSARRKRRDVVGSSRNADEQNTSSDGLRELSPDNLVKNPQKSGRKSGKKPQQMTGADDHVQSNNPNYEPPELTSFGAPSDEMDSFGEPAPGISEHEKAQLFNVLNLPSLDQWSFMMNFLKNSVLSMIFSPEPNYPPQPPTPAQPPQTASAAKYQKNRVTNEIFVDHSETKCYFPARNQGRCGSCWAFATTALYEWHYCKLTNKRAAFSEQYMVDCGHVINTKWWQELEGCRGGITPFVSKFVTKYGLELRKNYPYTYKQGECAYNLRDPRVAKSAGYIRMERQELEYVRFNKLEQYLKEAPIVMSFHTPEDFHSYGGGVDDAESCKDRQDKHHAMLIIGHGREEGKDYWLIRNSYSNMWGEEGHWRLNKQASQYCFDGYNAFRLKNIQITKDDSDPNYMSQW